MVQIANSDTPEFHRGYQPPLKIKAPSGISHPKNKKLFRPSWTAAKSGSNPVFSLSIKKMFQHFVFFTNVINKTNTPSDGPPRQPTTATTLWTTYMKFWWTVIGPFLSKKWPIFLQYFQKSIRYASFLWFFMVSVWKYMKNHQKQSQKAFSARENHYSNHLWYSILYRKYIRKSAISVISGRIQTRIYWAKNWIFTFCEKRLLRIEKPFHINSTCIFDLRPPSPLMAKNLIWVQKWPFFTKTGSRTGQKFWCQNFKFFH